MRQLQLCLMWALLQLQVLSLLSLFVSAKFYAPNHFLGTCFTDSWVKSMEIELNVSASARDPTTGQLLHPFLHAALPGPRYPLTDWRTANTSVFSPSCIPDGEVIYGPDAVVDLDTGEVISTGQVSGSLILELNDGAPHRLNTMIFAIVASELIGYNVSIYYSPASANIEQRLSLTSTQALCTPVHVNAAVSTRVSFSATASWLVLGELGNRVIRGIYTTEDLIEDGLNSTKYPKTFYADFWRDYAENDYLINELGESNLRNNSLYFPPNETYCADGVNGCWHHCSRTYACTLRETRDNKECLVVVATQASATRTNYPAMYANLDIPAYFCHIGRKNLQRYVLDMYHQRKGVTFYLDYPDEFTSRYPGIFRRISFPKGTAAEVAMTTMTFGENGYGQPSSNPARFDRFDDTNQKVVSYNMFTEASNGPAISVFSRIRVVDANLEDILMRFVTLTNDSSASTSEDPYFDSACSWMRENYLVWKDWMLSPLPLCTIVDHMTYTISGCEDDSTTHDITFSWAVPDPTNSANPYACDGGRMTLPAKMSTSRPCEWLSENTDTWIEWVDTRPACDETFYSYVAMECGADALRPIEFYWLLPQAKNSSASAECDGELPATIEIACEYMPVVSVLYLVIGILVWILVAGIFACMYLVFRFRDLPIVRRSQYEFLEVMLVGALLICASIDLYGGKPTDGLCGTRPVVLSVGFTLVFGSLVVKSLRVYRIFNTKKLKRVVLPSRTMFKVLGMFLLVDATILTSWFIVDFPSAKMVPDVIEEIGPDATVSEVKCSSSSFIFTGLLIFWKAILLGAGLYLSFLVRKVSSDFQESVYIFAASLVVTFSSLLLLPLAYLVPLEATTFYVFFAGVLWIATASVVALMLAPKFIRHKEVASSGSATSSNSDDRNSQKTETGPSLPEDAKPDKPKRGPTVPSGSRVMPSHPKRTSVDKSHAVVPSGNLT